MVEWPNKCPERDRIEESENEPHCFHDHPEGMICCFCGDLFLADESRASVHGPYDPTKKRSKKREQEKSS